VLAITGFGLCGCVAAFGPGYTIQKQSITVRFAAAPNPAIHIEAFYRVKNTGNQPLQSLELRLPGRRRFHFADPQATWDKTALTFETSPDNPRNVLLKLPQSWNVSAQHQLRLSVDYQPATSQENLSFTKDAFFLPAEGWSPQLLPARGIFATGGVPPQNWDLVVEVPQGFLVHSSGEVKKRQRKGSVGGSDVLRAVHDGKAGYPFVIAGRFQATELTLDVQRVHVWTLLRQDRANLQSSSEALIRATRAYDSMFGNQRQQASELWIVECPIVAGCFSSATSAYQKLMAREGEKTDSEMASSDTVMMDFTGGPSRIAAAAPSLASSWLGYGRNPGFYEQDPPLSALPAFAAAHGREAAEGGESRTETIRSLLRAIPENPPPQKEEAGGVLRAKSFLFFYALQDRYGTHVFDAALRHMLDARRGGGFDLDDLIASLEQESHQNVAEFVRLWMKHPGVPTEFRARYANSASAISKESRP
jgi:hypothetical protein